MDNKYEKFDEVSLVLRIWEEAHNYPKEYVGYNCTSNFPNGVGEYEEKLPKTLVELAQVIVGHLYYNRPSGEVDEINFLLDENADSYLELVFEPEEEDGENLITLSSGSFIIRAPITDFKRQLEFTNSLSKYFVKAKEDPKKYIEYYLSENF